MSGPNLPGWQSFLQSSSSNEPHAPATRSSGSRSSHSHPQQASTGIPPPLSFNDANFDLVTWYPSYQSCQVYFVNHAQFQGLVQTVAAFTNIRLPFQWTHKPINQLPSIDQAHHSTTLPSSATAPGYAGPSTASYSQHLHPTSSVLQFPPSAAFPFVSLVPYIRRLIVTGFDNEGVLHGFFGSDWREGIGPLHEIERRNYMFTTKSVGWAEVKAEYDMGPDQTVPFLKPLQRAQLAEIEKGEKHWSEWLAMEDWMIGPRAPDEGMERPSTRGIERDPGSSRQEETSMMMQQEP